MALQGFNGSLQGFTHSLQGFGAAVTPPAFTPRDISVMDDYVYVTDAASPYGILKFTTDGDYVTRFGGANFSSIDTYNGHIYAKTGSGVFGAAMYKYTDAGTLAASSTFNPVISPGPSDTRLVPYGDIAVLSSGVYLHGYRPPLNRRYILFKLGHDLIYTSKTENTNIFPDLTPIASQRYPYLTKGDAVIYSGAIGVSISTTPAIKIDTSVNIQWSSSIDGKFNIVLSSNNRNTGDFVYGDGNLYFIQDDELIVLDDSTGGVTATYTMAETAKRGAYYNGEIYCTTATGVNVVDPSDGSTIRSW